MQSVVARLESGVLTIGMNNPKVNALSSSFQNEIASCFRKAASDSNVKSVLLKSNLPTCFSAGLDMNELHELKGDNDKKLLQAFHAPIFCPKPVAAVIDGHAVAGGLGELRSQNDDHQHSNTKLDRKSSVNVSDMFEVKGYKVGITAHKVGVTYPDEVLLMFERQLPPHVFRTLCIDGELMNEHAAYQLGIGDCISSTPEAHALQWLQHMSSLPLGAFTLTKRKWWAKSLQAYSFDNLIHNTPIIP